MSRPKTEPSANRLRGYCRLCSRYYFVKNGMQTESVQVLQNHLGVCQKRHYGCARVIASAAWAETHKNSH